MNKKYLVITAVSLIFILLSSTFTHGYQGSIKVFESTEPNIVYVDDDNTGGPWDGSREHPFSSINEGISNAVNGDIIYVFRGVYLERVVVDKSVELTGEILSETIVDGTNMGSVVTIKENNVRINNFTIRNSGGTLNDTGVKVFSDGNNISNCVIFNTKDALRLENSENNVVENCLFYKNARGLSIKKSERIFIKNCELAYNAIGIQIIDSKTVSMLKIFSHENGAGVFCLNSTDVEMTNSAVSDNNDNEGGVFIKSCSKIVVNNSNVCHNGVGTGIENSSDVLLEKCDFNWNTHNALLIKKESYNITILECEIINNFRYGIDIEHSSCNIKNSNIENNRIYGVFSGSSNCDITFNWWGSCLGPSISELAKGDRISFPMGKHSAFPWFFKPSQNAGSNWETETVFKKTMKPQRDIHILFNETDSDNDGCPDWWEKKWGFNPYKFDDHMHLDPDNDGLSNIEECFTDKYGSNPYFKDLFLEIDWVESKNPGFSNKPTYEQLELMKKAFEKHNITLHVDVGELGGGEKISYMPRFELSELVDMYWTYFLHENINNPRKGVFHYGLVCDYGPGAGFAFVGWDSLDSFLISAQMLSDIFPVYSRDRLITMGSMHELGHTLGLFVDDFAGIDNRAAVKPYYSDFWLYKNYKSIMNYRYTWVVMDYSDGSHGKRDFNDWEKLDFYFFKNSHFEWPKI